MRLRMRGAGISIWRGVWLEEGVRAAGVVAPETRFAASDQDLLTGLLDRRSFITRAREQLQVPGHYEVIVADLDRLRRLNEALGHERADLVLAALGSRLAAAFPADAILARIGEDEFAAMAPAGASPGAEMLRRALEQPLRVAGFDIHPTLSIGAVDAHGGVDAPEAAELLRRAELAVESAKSHGRGGAAAYGRGLESDGLSRLALEGDLQGRARPRRAGALLPADRAALDRRAFRLRGPGPLAPPPPGPADARHLPAALRGDGPDGRAGRA